MHRLRRQITNRYKSISARWKVIPNRTPAVNDRTADGKPDESGWWLAPDALVRRNPGTDRQNEIQRISASSAGFTLLAVRSPGIYARRPPTPDSPTMHELGRQITNRYRAVTAHRNVIPTGRRP